MILAGALLAGCAGPPRAASGPSESGGAPPSGFATDGPPANPPPDVALTPDAEPRIEPLRVGGPNKPYEVLGQRYTPQVADEAFEQNGLASWYGRKFHGRRTASGEVYDMYAMTAAHRTLPIPSYALVRNPRNGRQVVVRINDRGPFKDNWIIDLSYAAAVKLGVERGVAPVQLRRLTRDEIIAGTWRSSASVASAAAPASALPPRPATPPAEVPVAAAPPPAPVAPPPALVAAAAPPAPVAPALPIVTDTAPVAAAPPVAVAAMPEIRAVAPPPEAGRFWLQFGAFGRREGAVELHRLLMQEFDWLADALTIFDERDTWRVQAGPYPSRSAAIGALQRIRSTAASLPPPILKMR